MPQSIPESLLNEAVAELDKVRNDFLRRPGVTAVDVGYKFKDGVMTDELAIRVHVKRKLPREVISQHELLPEHVGKFSVDIIEAEYGPETAIDAAPNT